MEITGSSSCMSPAVLTRRSRRWWIDMLRHSLKCWGGNRFFHFGVHYCKCIVNGVLVDTEMCNRWLVLFFSLIVCENCLLLWCGPCGCSEEEAKKKIYYVSGQSLKSLGPSYYAFGCQINETSNKLKGGCYRIAAMFEFLVYNLVIFCITYLWVYVSVTFLCYQDCPRFCLCFWIFNTRE